jgi:protein TonB
VTRFSVPKTRPIRAAKLQFGTARLRTVALRASRRAEPARPVQPNREIVMSSQPKPRSCRVSSRLTSCAAIAMLVAACGHDAPQTAARPPRAAVAPTAPTAPAVQSVGDLVARANRAFAEQRYVAPAGDNALELFLRVRELDAQHAGAQEALVELFPLTVSAIKAQLAREEYDEATRAMALLERAMPESMAVADLRADLDRRQQAAAEAAKLAKRQAAESAALATRPQEAEAARQLAAARAEKPAPPAPARVAATPAPSRAAASREDPPAASPSGGTAPMTAVAIAATTGAAPAPSVAKPPAPAVTGPQPVARYPAEYPPQAKQRRVEGWVELEFTVDVNGTVKDVAILASEPPKVFDRAAQRALLRWKFKPAQRDGRPEAARTRTTISFKLG